MCYFLMEEIYLILSGLEIKKHIGKEIIIDPFDEKRHNLIAITFSCIMSFWFMMKKYWI